MSDDTRRYSPARIVARVTDCAGVGRHDLLAGGHVRSSALNARAAVRVLLADHATDAPVPADVKKSLWPSRPKAKGAAMRSARALYRERPVVRDICAATLSKLARATT